MVRGPYQRLHGYPLGKGITRRERPKPWLVKFKRNRKSVYVGSFFTLRAANLAAERFLRNE